MSTYSKEHLAYLKKKKRRKRWILFWQVFLLCFFLCLWEVAASYHLINTFLASSPSLVIKTFYSLVKNYHLFLHVAVTLYETIISFVFVSALGFLISILLWWHPFLAKVLDPYLTVLNSLPKVALGPLIIIWVGADINSIIFMALLISLFVCIINIYHDFKKTDKSYILLLESFHASKREIFFKVVLPSNIKNIINHLKINISMVFIGVIMGELLVSKKGLGYLIMYGTQVFNINLVIAAIFILGTLSFSFYYLVCLFEKRFY